MFTRNETRTITLKPDFPRIVCLCGSTRFARLFKEVNLALTKQGIIVLSIGIDTKSDADLLLTGALTEADKQRLDRLHLYKIDLADGIVVLNAPLREGDTGGYTGSSTDAEISYAYAMGKEIHWWYPDLIPYHWQPAWSTMTLQMGQRENSLLGYLEARIQQEKER